MEFAAQLGIKYNTFMKHLDSTRPLWSPSLNMYITLLQAGSSPVDAVIQGPYLTTDPIKGVDLHSLPQGIIALAKDKVTRLGVYLSAGQAAFLLDGKVDRTYIYRYINIEYLVSTSLGLVYFVMNPGYVAPGVRLSSKEVLRESNRPSLCLTLFEVSMSSSRPKLRPQLSFEELKHEPKPLIVI